MQNKQIITEREMAVVRLSVYYPGKTPLPLLYSLAYPGTFADAQALKDLPAVASRWWRSKKIQDFLNSETAVHKATVEAQESRIIAECMARLQSDADSDQARGLDYSRPENQRQKLNELINGATDPHDALDALKTMIQRQQDIAPEHRNQGKPIRVYLPIVCSDCIIYKIHDEIRTNYPELNEQLKEIAETLKNQ